MQVALLITCLTDTFYPRVGEAAVRLLRHCGCDVVVPAEQTCCGQPAYNSGCVADARPLLRRLARIFADYPYIVTPSASCATMITRHGPELLADEPEACARLRGVAGRTHELLGFLQNMCSLDIAATLRVAEPLTYHYPCHAQAYYSLEILRDWLAPAAGTHLREPAQPDLCCGFGGTFAVDQPEISGALLGDKLRLLSATGAHRVVCNEAGCALHLTGGARRAGQRLRFSHLAELLAESLQLLPPAPAEAPA